MFSIKGTTLFLLTVVFILDSTAWARREFGQTQAQTQSQVQSQAQGRASGQAQSRGPAQVQGRTPTQGRNPSKSRAQSQGLGLTQGATLTQGQRGRQSGTFQRDSYGGEELDDFSGDSYSAFVDKYYKNSKLSSDTGDSRR